MRENKTIEKHYFEKLKYYLEDIRKPEPIQIFCARWENHKFTPLKIVEFIIENSTSVVFLDISVVKEVFDDTDIFKYLYGNNFYIVAKNTYVHFFRKEAPILLKEVKEMSLNNLISEINQNFCNHFGIMGYSRNQRDPKLVVDNSITKETSADEKFRSFIESNSKNILLSIPEVYMIETSRRFFPGIVVGTKKNSEFSYEKAIRIKNDLIKIFRKREGNPLNINEATYLISRFPNYDIVERPINSESIIKTIKEFPDVFCYNSKKDSINCKFSIQNIFNELSSGIKYEELKFKFKNYGIVSFIFDGESFPLKEAKEYVSTRRILFITPYLQIFLNNNLNFNSSDKNEFIINLQSILPTGTNLTDWILENVKIAFYEEGFYDKNEVEELSKFLIKEYSPLLNLKDNPDNLFKYTLNEKREKFLQNLGTKNGAK